MNISISSLKVNSISNIGSINIGKTILSHNRAVMTSTDQTEKETSAAEDDNNPQENDDNPPPVPPIPPSPTSPPSPVSPPSSSH